MLFRKAVRDDILAIADIYDRIHAEEETGRAVIGWNRAIYPTRATAERALIAGDLYVADDGGTVVAAARINTEQVPEYTGASWSYDAPAEKVSVLHTLVVDPERKGQGIATSFVVFYEALSKQTEKPYLRMDTNARNVAARSLYRKLGYREVSTVPCTFNGIPGVSLVCLEKTLL